MIGFATRSVKNLKLFFEKFSCRTIAVVNSARLNIERSDELITYLLRVGLVTPDETPQFEVLAGGVSNRAVLVRREPRHGESWVIKQALRKLRVDVDWFSDPVRIHREASGLQCLTKLLPEGTVPHYIFEDKHEHLFAMTAVPDPHVNWKTKLLDGQLDCAHVRQFAEVLGTIHGRASEQSEQLVHEFGDRSFFESLRLEPYYAYTREQVPAVAAFFEDLIDDTRTRRLTLVHGDYSPKNVLVHNNRLVLLDHEVIHWGDPAFDLGFSMTHLLSKAHYMPAMREEFVAATRDYWQAYRVVAGSGDWQHDLEAFAVRHTLGCLLARVAGRSPLEYLNERHRAAQQRAVISIINNMPATVEVLIDQFIYELPANA